MIRIILLRGLSSPIKHRLYAAQREAGRLVTECVKHHSERRQSKDNWPDKNETHALTKGRFAIHSQTIQAVAYQVLANVQATRERRRSEPSSREWLRYLYKEKKFFASAGAS